MGSCVITQQPNQNGVTAGLRLAPTKLHQMLIYSKRDVLSISLQLIG